MRQVMRDPGVAECTAREVIVDVGSDEGCGRERVAGLERHEGEYAVGVRHADVVVVGGVSSNVAPSRVRRCACLGAAAAMVGAVPWVTRGPAARHGCDSYVAELLTTPDM